ncbi:MAG TPA: hypothetical protein VFV87_22655, partial [Pirellulaceae bacterium]|nr:hypothetical protein [Pirellulaceae bacterium]
MRRACLAALVLLAAGCGQREQITSYTVKKPELIDPTHAAAPTDAKPQQILGAIVVLDESGWFFKVTGDPAQVEPQRDTFLSLVKSIRFSNGPDPRPNWDLPEGWRELPGDQFRFATLQMPTDQGSLDLAISMLSRSVEADEFVLVNVNRWRGQVGLSDVDQAELADSSNKFQVDGHDCTFVNLVGESSGGGMGRAPFAPFAGGASAAPGSSPTEPVRPKSAATSAGDELVFEAPKGWTPGKTTEFRRAAFSVTDGDNKVEITVIPLGAGSGSLLENVNRWRGQVGLKAAQEVAGVKKIETLGIEGDYVELQGPDQSMLAVMAPVGDRVWYIKLLGDPELAKR